MDQAKLIKMAPTALMITFLGYLGYSVDSGIEEQAAALTSAAQSTAGAVISEIESEISSLESAVTPSSAMIRDPFRTLSSIEEEKRALTAGELTGHTDVDEDDQIAELLKGMTLSITYIRGTEQFAVIDGKTYRRGENLRLPDLRGDSVPPLLVAVVRKDKVYLRGGNKTYSIGYSDDLNSTLRKPSDDNSALESEMAEIDPAGELKFYQSLSNSPLGRIGKGLTGSMGIKLPTTDPNRARSSHQ